MYMVRQQAETDLAAAFKTLKDAGFDNVELYPIAYHQPAQSLRRLLEDTGLTFVSGHFDYAARPSSIEYAHTLGLKYLVCAWIDEPQRTPDGFKRAADHFNGWAHEAAAANMTFAFHNHCYEFKPLAAAANVAGDPVMPETTGWQILLNRLDPTLVKFELDIFWLATAGQNTAAVLHQLADRTVLIHLKDRTANAPISYVPDAQSTSFCTELGKGTINWPTILRQAQKQGIRYAFLDQDETTIPIPESLRQSNAYLRHLTL
jgi:sugar phosphate isomerase/epimerase